MPICKTKTALELARNVRLFLNVEAGVTGLEAILRRAGSNPKARVALAKLEAQPATAKLAARLRNGVSRLQAATPSGNDAVQTQSLAKRNRKLAQTRNSSNPPPSLKEGTPVFFVVGVAKSGTSWLMDTLNSHPEILCKGEGRFFGSNFNREQATLQARKSILASSLYNALLDSEYLRLWIERSVWTRRNDPDEHLVNLAHVAINYFLTQELAKTDKKIVGDKTPLLNPEFVEEINLIYPEAKVIHIIRDGRDSAVSMMHHMWNSSERGGVQKIEPEEIEKRDAYRRNPQKILETGEGIFTKKRLRQVAETWNLRVGKAIEDGPALFGDNYMEVRYEDLLERPHEEVRMLAAFLGADTSDAAVEQAVSSTSFEKQSNGRERGQEDSTSFFRKGISGDWKNYFTERDKEIYKEAAGDLLVKLGYEKDYTW